MENYQTSKSGSESLTKARARAMRAILPSPDLSASEWADQERALSPKASAEPGKWHTARAERAAHLDN